MFKFIYQGIVYEATRRADNSIHLLSQQRSVPRRAAHTNPHLGWRVVQAPTKIFTYHTLISIPPLHC